MDLEITFGVPKNQKVRVAKIIYEAFENKFENIFGPKKQSIPLISKHLRNNRIVVAIREGVVVGVGGLEFKGKRFFDVSFWQLLRELKFGIFRVMFLGWIFCNKVEEKELLVDALAVARNIRGKGIGSNLINFIIDFARSRGYEQVKLFVIDANEKAKKLYERIGFKKVKAHRIPFPWNRIFGFNRTSEMTYRI
ncbi:GNAT family N-acetyltransferase [Candidatus Bathyarchaeota archaeon]|nr:GNAT family N-acetyltransferase [Candidatus Bathyarchaeota archaeon]